MPNRPHNPDPIPQQCINCPIRKLHTTTPKDTKLLPQRKLDIHTETTIICHYCQNASSLQLAQQHGVTPDTIQNILRRYNRPVRTLIAAQRNRRNSPTLTFPLSSEVPTLLEHAQTRPFLPHLIAVALLTEGAAGYRQTGQPYLTFTNKAESLHAIFADLIHYAYDVEPSAYYRPYWSRAGKQGAKAYYTTYFRRESTGRMLQHLMTLTPIFRTRPKRGQSWSDYLKEPLQPTLRFLLRDDIPEAVAVFALRLAMSAEGTISPMFRRDSAYPHPHLVFSCSHPGLLSDWQRFFRKQGITFNPAEIKLETAALETASTFLSIGGFFNGVGIRENSYYHGIDRQDVLKAILIERKNFPIDPNLPLPDRHAMLRKRLIRIGQEGE